MSPQPRLSNLPRHARTIIGAAVLSWASAWPGAIPADEVTPGIFRTPDARFEKLTDFPFEPHYAQIGEYRVHYLDEGPADAAPVLLLHGEPTWSYLYRNMIPVLTAAGHRVIAPDLVGFGRSDKPADEADYSYQLQMDTMLELVRRLDLEDATFFGQDWGGLVGLRVVAAEPDRFARVVISNTGLPAASGLQGYLGYPLFKLAVWWTGPITLEDLRAETTFPRWVAYSYHVDELPIGELLRFMGGDEAVGAAYEAPFPDARYKAGAQIMPYLVPSQLRENERAWREVFEPWDKPFLVAFSDSDPITAGSEQTFIERIPTAQSVTIRGAGHFVQEDAGPQLAALINDFIAGRRVRGFTAASPASE
ncbi:MAG: haloalkane dehalogenase [Pseudomonadales bacterium]